MLVGLRLIKEEELKVGTYVWLKHSSINDDEIFVSGYIRKIIREHIVEMDDTGEIKEWDEVPKYFVVGRTKTVYSTTLLSQLFVPIIEE